ncbi:MAG: succinate dehydrogenase [Vampirovibrionales bacterium]
MSVPSSPSTSNLRTQGFGVTDRYDAWWAEQVFTIVVMALFTVYALWRASENGHFEVGPYFSPFYSPNLKAMFPQAFEWVQFSPAFLILWAPLGFRGTCYFYRRTYYRAVFNDPPACAVDKPKQGLLRPLADYTGETVFPFVLQNFHRYFLYVALVLVGFHWYHAIESIQHNGQLGFGVGSLIIWLDTIFLSLYVFSCHSLRHLIGGKLNFFTNGLFNKFRFNLWKGQTILNQEHWFYAWGSLFTVGLCDLYIRLVSAGVIKDWNTWGIDFASMAHAAQQLPH